MIHEQQLRIVEAQVNEAVAQGARLRAGGARLPKIGSNFYAPTVLADVTHSMRIMREETFGPVLSMRLSDTTRKRFASRMIPTSGWRPASGRATPGAERRLPAQIAAGTVMVNDTISCFGISEAPHGGVKSSGLGRAHGQFGLEEMVRIKYLDTDRLPRMKKIWWYGYGRVSAARWRAFSTCSSPTASQTAYGRLKSAGALTKPKL